MAAVGVGKRNSGKGVPQRIRTWCTEHSRRLVWQMSWHHLFSKDMWCWCSTSWESQHDCVTLHIIFWYPYMSRSQHELPKISLSSLQLMLTPQECRHPRMPLSLAANLFLLRYHNFLELTKVQSNLGIMQNCWGHGTAIECIAQSGCSKKEGRHGKTAFVRFYRGTE